MAMSPAVTLDSLRYHLTSASVSARPTSWTLSLHTGPPGADGTGNEATYSGYVRKSLTMAVDNVDPVYPFAYNSAAVAFAAAPGGGVTITHVVVWGGAEARVIQALAEPKAIAAGVVPTLAQNELIVGGR